MKCPRCEQENPPQAKFCLECGTPFKRPDLSDPPAASYADTDLQRALSEAVEQQRATNEILRVISSSPTDLQPVFDTIVRNAARVCEAFDAVVVLADGEEFVQRAHHGPIAAVLGARYPLRGTVGGRAILEARVVHVENLAEASDYPVGHELAQRVGYRTTLSVPLLRDGAAIGAIGIRRTEVLPFTDNQIALLQTFADQAVIAIENVRLFNELGARNRDLSESLDRQTATADVLRIIAQSPTELQPVLDAIATSAVRLCAASDAVIERLEGDRFYNAAHAGVQMKGLVGLPLPLTRRFPGGRAILDRKRVIVDDIQLVAESEYPDVLDLLKLNTVRSCAEIPLLSEGKPLGNLAVLRAEVRPFTDAEVALLETFADQAVIAIENVRLFTELQEKNRALTAAHAQVTEALEQQTATSEILRAISASPTDLQGVLDTVAASAARLCDSVDAQIFRVDGTMLRIAAFYGQLPKTTSADARPISRGSVNGRAVVDRQTIHVHDLAAESDTEFPIGKAYQKRFGHRTLVATPLLREGAPIGAITIRRMEVRPFSEKEIKLLETFADQAVIAIENVRLFNELQERNREVEQKSQQLAAASQHKSEFLANMSHELRTPLNAIIGFSEVLGERMFGELNAKQEEYLKDIHASGQHLLSLINDILDLSKIEAGRMELELADFHLPQAIENALVLVRERALRRGITLEQSIDPRLGEIQGDERKVKQVLLNLLSNAIKFTPESGRIDVRAKPVNGSVEISVSDTGVGIAPEDQQAIFEEFRQVGAAAKKVEGTGLGLALSRKFIELHGGRIWVESQVGTGSTFTFTLPVLRGE
jgi:two-component system, NtrC family, sensor kinase